MIRAVFLMNFDVLCNCASYAVRDYRSCACFAAARMEQSGRPGLVHMTAEAATQLHREGPEETPLPPFHLTEIKSKGTMLTAWWDNETIVKYFVLFCIQSQRQTFLAYFFERGHLYFIFFFRSWKKMWILRTTQSAFILQDKMCWRQANATFKFQLPFQEFHV